MQQLGAIEKVDQPTELVDSIVIVEKPDANLRICLDRKEPSGEEITLSTPDSR